MSGPIVRTGTTPKFWENWENVFGKGKGGAKPAARKTPAAAQKPAKKTTKATPKKGTAKCKK